MLFTKIPEDTFKNIQLNAGIICDNFNPKTRQVGNILGATKDDINFTADPSFEDFGEDINNCPKNTKELKKLTEWAIALSTSFVTLTIGLAKKLIGAGDISGSKIVPRNDILTTDYTDIWWIGDYSDKNTGEDAGFCAIHMMNVLNTGGFHLTSTDKGKGKFDCNFEAHYSMNAQDTVPFEVYVVQGGSNVLGSILFDTHTLEVEAEGTATIRASVEPSNAEITWTSSDSSVATVSNGVVTGVAEGNAIIKGSITVDGVTYDDTCTVIVTEAEG